MRNGGHVTSYNPTTPDLTAAVLFDGSLQANDLLIAIYSGRADTLSGHGPSNVVFYREATMREKADFQFAATRLSKALATEATALIDLGIVGPLRYRIALAHWGISDPFVGGVSEIAPFYLDLTHLKDDPTAASTALSVALAALVVALGDGFFALRIPHALPKPALPSLMQKAPHELPGWSWAPISATYFAALRQVASSSPELAAELAAKAALSGDNAGEYAKGLLRFATEQFPWPAQMQAEDEARYGLLAQYRPQSALLRAFVDLKGYPPPDPPSTDLTYLSRLFVEPE